MRARWRITSVMDFRRRAAFLAGLAVLGVAGLGGTTDRSEAGSARGKTRLVAFNSCGDLLGYVKSQANRFVGPYGLGATGVVKGLPPVPAATASPARDTGPQQGVDYSGTNVQEEGVDEPDMVKTNGTTLFGVA